MPLHLTKRDGTFFLLGLVLVVVYVLVAGDGFPLDDSWIHQTYGRNLALLGEWSFVVGQPSAASTSPLYTVLLAIGYRLGVSYAVWTHGLGVFALALTGMLGARLADQVIPNSNGRLGWIVGLGLILTWHLIWAASSGMETMLFSMLTLLLMHLVWRENNLNRSQVTRDIGLRGLLYGIASALAMLARPEGILLVGLGGLTLWIVNPWRRWQSLIMWTVGAIIGFGLAASPYLWLNWQLTGGVLPNTAGAKFEQHRALLEQSFSFRFTELSSAMLAGGQFLLLPALIVYGWLLRQKPWRQVVLYILPLLWIVCLITIYAVRLPAAYQHGRYVIPALPAFVLIAIVGLWSLLQIRRLSLIPRVLLRVWALSTLLIYVIFVGWGATILRTDVAIINNEMVASAHWIRDNLPEDELLAIHDIGAVGYFANRPMLDIAGLVSPEVVPIVADGSALWALMQERDARYLMAFPDQIPDDNPDDPRLCVLFTTDSAITRSAGGANMTIYRLSWNETCDP